MEKTVNKLSDTGANPATVEVGLGDRAYDILIAADLLNHAGGEICRRFEVQRIAVVSDDNVNRLYGDRLAANLKSHGLEVSRISVPPGESSKSYATLERVTGDLLASGIERGDLVVALGGGVVGDLAGFAAGILRRGVRFIQIPTSLLAQVDSSVGGKTGINSPHGKNLIGMFHQPSLVLADVTALDTLPSGEMRACYAEVVKYGLISDLPFFEWLEQHGGAMLSGDRDALIHAITVCCQTKADIVAADERESGVRALLNLGHTFGHALEAAVGYDGRLIHGEGVSIGMVLAAQLSVALGFCPGQDATRIEAHLKSLELPTRIAQIPGYMPGADQLIDLMAQDKKVRKGKLTFILLNGIGKAFATQDVTLEQLRDFMETMHKLP